jgi:hypothetical protein
VLSFYRSYTDNMQKLQEYVHRHGSEDDVRDRAIQELSSQVRGLLQNQLPAETRHSQANLSTELTNYALKVHEVKMEINKIDIKADERMSKLEKECK